MHCSFFSLDICYLDHVGATLYADSQIQAVARDLCENVYGNPHSLNTASRYSTDIIDQIRYRYCSSQLLKVQSYFVSTIL